MYYAWIAIVVVAAIIAKILFHKRITFPEMAAIIAIPVIVISTIWFTGRYSETTSYELWSGEVVKKEAIKKNCPYGWVRSTDSFCTNYATRVVRDGETCYTDTQGKRQCTPNYVTEYNYYYSWEQRYFVQTNVGEFEISREDAQGKIYPRRMHHTQVGEPVAVTRQYTNWIKAVPESLFYLKSNTKNPVPVYPEVYDYWKVNRLIQDGVTVENAGMMSERINHHQRMIGPKKQGNIIVVLLNNPNRADEIISGWNGGEKNDILIFVQVDGEKIVWARSFSWSKNDYVNVLLRDKIIEHGKVDVGLVDMIAGVVTENYERKPMAEFEYLKDNIQPPTWVVVLCSLFAVIGTGLLIFVMWINSIRSH